MIVSKEYAAAWGLAAKNDKGDFPIVSIDLGAGKIVVVELVKTSEDAPVEGEASVGDERTSTYERKEVEHDLADFEIDGLERFKLMHGG